MNNDAKAAAEKPRSDGALEAADTINEPIYENGEIVGSVKLSGDAKEATTNG